MKDLKEVIAGNIYSLRVAAKMSQSALADVLHYSDKAVSKWERAESIPDVFVLQRLAAYFGVSVDYLLTEDHTEERAPVVGTAEKTNRVLITLLATSLVWLIATFLFVIFKLTDFPAFPIWLFYVYSVPVSAVVLLVFNAIWGRRRRGFLIVSVLIWGVLLSLFLTFLTVGSHNFWPIFILGVPAQAIVILWSGLHVRPAAKP